MTTPSPVFFLSPYSHPSQGTSSNTLMAEVEVGRMTTTSLDLRMQSDQVTFAFARHAEHVCTSTANNLKETGPLKLYNFCEVYINCRTKIQVLPDGMPHSFLFIAQLEHFPSSTPSSPFTTPVFPEPRTRSSPFTQCFLFTEVWAHPNTRQLNLQ